MSPDRRARHHRFAYPLFTVYTAVIVTAILVILVWGGHG